MHRNEKKGDLRNAIQYYTSALECIGDSDDDVVAATLLSNRAMCHLKAAEAPSQAESTRQSINDCVEDCTAVLERLDAGAGGPEHNNALRGKVLYRRSKALVIAATSVRDPDTDGSDDDERESMLNRAAKDLLQLLSFDADNKDAVALLRTAKSHHGKLGGGMGRSRISRALDGLRRRLQNTSGAAGDIESHRNSANGTSKGEDDLDALQCLRILQGSLVEDVTSSAEDIGRRGGVELLLQIARHGIAGPDDERTELRVASLHVLSGCCSHGPFLLRHAGRDNLAPPVLAQIVEEEAALSNEGGGSADVAVASMALLVRLIVHWEHCEVARFFAPRIQPDGTVEEPVALTEGGHVQEVDGSSVCRMAKAAFVWGSCARNGGPTNNDTKAPRAALDLIAAWTASNLDALDAASEACYAPLSSSPQNWTGQPKASHHKLTPEDVRGMKPRQVAAHRKREADYQHHNLQRAIRNISAFCSEEVGGLDSMLACAARVANHRLRREVGLQIGRMMSVFEEEDDVKMLIHKALGCTNWKVGKEDENSNVTAGLSTLTIEELDEEKEMDGDGGKEEGPDEELLAMMKRGQLTSSLLLGKPDVGTWAMKHGWSDGNGVEELKELISSNDPCAMSIASELVSAASSVESSRPLLLSLVEEGTLEDLLIHEDVDVRSGAASCAAKIGLASKALSADNDEVMELLDVAIELLFEEDDNNPGGERDVESSSKAKAFLTTKQALSNAAGDSTSMDRGIEVMAYLASKTFVKEKIANGYKPKGSPTDRKTALQRLVEIACTPKSGCAQMAYGLAGIFNLLAVSVETLRKEAFVGKEITEEQYGQLQCKSFLIYSLHSSFCSHPISLLKCCVKYNLALGKTEEEKAAEAKKNEREGDSPGLVSERVRKMANANVPRAMVKLMEGSSSDATQEKLLEAMGRMASETSVRGIMIQQGVLTNCLQLDKGVR